jgi:hypothetical protein
MANVNVRVVGHWADVNGKIVPHLGTGQQFDISVALVNRTDGSQQLDPASVNQVMTNNSKYRSSATQFVVTGYALLDKEHAPAGVLS